MKKNSYKLKAILIVESMGLFNLCSIYFYQNGKKGKDRLPFLGYKACLDHLDSNFSIPFYKVLPVNQFLLWVTNFSIIAFNIFLYKYLDKQTKENTGNYFHSMHDPSIDDLISQALSAVDQRKNRRRNFISAKVGIISLGITLFFYPVAAIAYSAPIEISKKDKRWINMFNCYLYKVTGPFS